MYCYLDAMGISHEENLHAVSKGKYPFSGYYAFYHFDVTDCLSFFWEYVRK